MRYPWIKKHVAKELWRQISSFAGYAFCKAHSASFALLSYQVAYLKVHYPAEFMAGVLSNGGGYYSAAVYIQEACRLGLKIPSAVCEQKFIFIHGEGDQLGLVCRRLKILKEIPPRL
ncbi:MAG: hypothetical protein IPG53_03505 [Ignavibacteriales bacterium]|nr:hypothetical protein [Ignavibacteriales bacterium]